MNVRRVSLALKRIGLYSIVALALPASIAYARGPVGATPGIDTITVAHARALQRVADARTFLAGLTPVNVYTVTSTADLPDDSIDDGVFFPQTFRSAIENANRNPDYDMIVFDLAGATLGITSQLPTVSQPCLIDGAGTGTSPVIVDGTAAGAVPGVWINADGCVVRNLEIQNFNGAGLVVGSTVKHRNMIVHNVRSHDNAGAGINTNELSDCLIGGTAPTETNRVYGNTGTGGHGISFTGLFLNNDSNVVIGNWIGTSNGADSAGNSRWGIFLESGRNNIISNNIIVANEYGGLQIGDELTKPDRGNVIEHNLIGVASDGATPLVDLSTNAPGIYHRYSQEDTIRCNVISGHPDEQIHLDVSTFNFLIDSNLVGTSWDTTQNANGGFEAILIFGAGHLVRGNLCNNSTRGISVRSSGTSNTIQGNWAGRHDNHQTLWANGVGIMIQGHSNTVGGPNPEDVNVCSWDGTGILLRGTACSLNVVQGNTVGLNSARTDSVPNGSDGIAIQRGATKNQILDNVIGSNWGSGVHIRVLSGLVPRENVVQGNYIGVSPVGMTPFPNASGVDIDTSHGNLIGGLGVDEYNYIGYNLVDGVQISGDSNSILNNTIVANAFAGVNVVEGVYNTIRLGIIDDNGDLGIDLGEDGVTANDGPNDLDAGPNMLQNYPVIDSIRSGAADSVFGRLEAEGDTTFMLDFYVSASCDPTKYGEGEFWRDSIEVRTNASGVANFALDITGAFAGPEKWLTITATDPDGNTSEFCRCDTISAPGGVIPDTVDIRVNKVADMDTVLVGDTVLYTITVKNGGPDNAAPISMVDTVPSGMNYLDHTIGVGSCSFAGDVLTCNIPALLSGDSTVITISAEAASPGITLNKALAAAAQVEANPIDNRDSAEVVIETGVAVGDDYTGVVPQSFALGRNYPNPFNPITEFTFDLPEPAPVRIVVYNVIGQAVRTLVDRVQPAGRYTVTWDGRDEQGRSLSSGVYLYRMTSGSFSATQRMILLK